MAEHRWVEERVERQLLPDLVAATTEEEVKARCSAEVAYWKERFPDKPNSWKAPHSQSRKLVSLSSLSDEKKAWVTEYLSLGKEHWVKVAVESAARQEERLKKQLELYDPERIVNQAEKLLESQRWSDIAAGLALLTGRRSTEILQSAEFQPCTHYSVLFSGQIKHEVDAFEIPTLIEAQKVLDALKRMREALNVSDRSRHDVSNSYRKSVTSSVRRHFETLIPARPGEYISTQDLRAVYQRIAIYYFAPPLADAETYAGAIAGHRSKADPEQISHGAGPSYRDYKLFNAQGEPDGRQGVKLDEENVSILASFAGSYDPATRRIGALKSVSTPRPQAGILSPEMLFTGDMLQLVKDGMEAAKVVDFMSYLATALKSQAKRDLGQGRHDTVKNVEKMSMEELTKSRKHSTANERIRRGVCAIADYNDSHSQYERFFINATLLSYLLGARFQTIQDWLKEHQEVVDEFNNKYGLTEKYNRKPFDVRTEIKNLIPVE